MDKQNVVTYYEKSLPDYQLLWFRGKSLAMNYGYWDSKTHTHDEAMLRLNEIITKKLHIQKTDRVLDAGCGLGGTSLWLADELGCHVEGVSITPDQITRATGYAQSRGLQELAHFSVADYTRTAFPQNSFDVVIAIETICHLVDKKEFYREMMRILRPGGRLLVAEYIAQKAPYNASEKKSMNAWLSGWEIPNLWTPREHTEALTSLKFKDISIEEYGDHTDASAKRLYYFSLPGIPFYRMLHALHVLPVERLKNAQSSRYQWLTKRDHLWTHAFICAQK